MPALQKKMTIQSLYADRAYAGVKQDQAIIDH